MKKRKLTLWIHREYEMAELKDGRETLLLGNYWDFYAGCHGTVVTFKDGSEVDFEKEWTDRIKGPHAVAKMMTDKIGAELVTRERKTPIDC